MKTLSILIPIVPFHKEMADKLIAKLEAQGHRDEIEILTTLKPHVKDGGPPVGARRNELLYNARGEYIVYFDADDQPSDGSEHPAYIPSIFQALESGPIYDTILATPQDKVASFTPRPGPRIRPDCVGITGQLRFANDPYLFFYHSMKHSIDWWDDKATAPPGKAQYYRTPNHLNPIKREIALACKFESTSSWSEDHSYGRLVHKLIKTETPIDHPIYYYVK